MSLHMPFIVWLLNRDGEEITSREFESEEELLKKWPEAEKIDTNEYETWMGAQG